MMSEMLSFTNLERYPGLHTIYKECLRVYPDQTNPLQINNRHKLWLGGRDPMDYISLYQNDGNPEKGVPPHWHYVSFGLTELHGDGRVHKLTPKDEIGPETVSGFGFELTFRLKRHLDEEIPPVWPATLMNILARYFFDTKNLLLPGDHFSWYQPLNGQETIIKHMLFWGDAEFRTVKSPYGKVSFVQIVGISGDELNAIQSWNGSSVAEMMKTVPGCGGEYLVTEMDRKCMFEIDPSLRAEVNQGIARDGSNLVGISSECNWNNDAWKFYDETNIHFLKPKYRTLNISLRKQQSEETDTMSVTGSTNSPNDFLQPDMPRHQDYFSDPNIPKLEQQYPPQMDNVGKKVFSKPTPNFKGFMSSSNVQIKAEDSSTYVTTEGSPVPLEGMFNELRMSCDSDKSSEGKSDVEIFGKLSYYDNMHISLNLESALMLPLVLEGRVRHGCHFTFKSANMPITLVSPRTEGVFTFPERPFGSCGSWLQLQLDPALIEEILVDLEAFMNTDATSFPKTFLWPEYYFAITVTP